MIRFAGVPACALLALLAGGCGLSLEPDAPPRADGGASDTGSGAGDAANDAPPPPDAPGADAGPDAGPDATMVDAGPDALIGECRNAADCDLTRGAPPACAMASWECVANVCLPVCPGCTDGDRDGYGPEPECVAGDCNDADPAVTDTATASCYTGASGTSGTGACTAGTSTCTAGAWTGCFGEVTPSGETCNGVDDDCDGTADELGRITCGVGACTRTVDVCASGALATCTPGPIAGGADLCDGVDTDCDGTTDEDCTCLHVTAGTPGNDTTGTGTGMAPYATINRALMRIAGDPTAPRVVCVAQGANCSGTLTYRENVDVPDAVFINGAYEHTTWTRCRVGVGAPPRTVIQNGRNEGVVFGPAVTSATGIDGFRIDRVGSSPAVGISVDASRHVTLSNLAITDQPVTEQTYGIVMTGGAQATILRSWIYGGPGTRESVGIKSVGSVPNVRESCNDFTAAGACDQDCYDTSQRGIGGRVPNAGSTLTAGGAGSTSTGILLEDSPNAVITRTAVCAGHATIAAGTRVLGDADGVIVSFSRASGYGGQNNAWGLRFEGCGGDSPLVVRNRQISVERWMGTPVTAAVSSVGDCHPAIEENDTIVGDLEGAITNALAIECASDGTAASLCSIENNQHIYGTSPFAVPRSTTAIRCSDGGCGRIVGNPDVIGRNATVVTGVHLQRSSPLIAGNRIVGGCTSAGDVVALRSEDGGSRIENNFMVAGFCGDTPFTGLTYTVLRAIGDPTSGRELDVNGNTFATQGRFAGCTGTSIELVSGLTGGTPAGTGLGIYRNNLIRGGICPTDRLVVEADAGADPRELSFAMFDDTTAGLDTYYLDEGAVMIAAGALGGVAPSSLTGNPLYRGGRWDLGLVDPASPTNGAGTPLGAPAVDIEGNPRDATSPDIGADEN